MYNKIKFLSIFLLLILLSLMFLIGCSSKNNDTPFNNISYDNTQSSKTTEVHNHTWSEWITETEVTCTSKGLKYRVCSCGKEDTISYAALGHDIGDWIVINESTCQSVGTEEKYCSRCNYKLTQSIPIVSHAEGQWIIVNDEKHLLCLYCGTSLKIEKIYVSDGINIENGVVISLGTCSDKEIVVPAIINGHSVSIIGSKAFQNTDILSITLLDTVNTISESAFYKCFSLERVEFGNNITQIGKKAFFNCTSLSIIYLPDSLLTLGELAFSHCTNLSTVYIGKHITKLEMRVFEDCKNLTDIYFSGTVDEWNKIEKDDEWDTGTPDYVIHCIDGDISK